MICPNCSTSIPDGSLRCPACHADLAVTSVLPRLQGRWCPSCGSLVPDDKETCPSCGMYVALPRSATARGWSTSEVWLDFVTDTMEAERDAGKAPAATDEPAAPARPVREARQTQRGGRPERAQGDQDERVTGNRGRQPEAEVASGPTAESQGEAREGGRPGRPGRLRRARTDRRRADLRAGTAEVEAASSREAGRAPRVADEEKPRAAGAPSGEGRSEEAGVRRTGKDPVREGVRPPRRRRGEGREDLPAESERAATGGTVPTPKSAEGRGAKETSQRTDDGDVPTIRERQRRRPRRVETVPTEEPAREETSAEAQGEFVPHFDSAIPMGEDRFGIDARQDRMPRTAAFLVAAVASIFVIGGSTLLITRPWESSAQVTTRATDAKDTSQAGYPGEFESLSGQDLSALRRNGSAERDEKAFELLREKYERLGSLRKELEENEGLLFKAIDENDPNLVAGGYGVAESAVIETGSIINDLSTPEVTGSAYSDQAIGIKELSGSLRAWAKAMLQSWVALDNSYSPSYAEGEVLQLLYESDTRGTNAAMRAFDESYVNRFPTEVLPEESSEESGSAGSATDAAQAGSVAAP